MPTSSCPDTAYDSLIPSVVAALPAAQQPRWPDPGRLARVHAELARAEPLVTYDSVLALRRLLSRAADGELCVLQAGDCAEDPAECDPAALARKAEMLDVLSDIVRTGAGRPVVRVGRIAGQYAKPRSQPEEEHDGVRLPVFRGALVNAPDPDPAARRPDPARILRCHRAARQALASLDRLGRGEGAPAEARVWTSHEALLLDYELPQVRRHRSGRSYLASTHWPWVGERTRQPDGAHVRLLAHLDNPVACKIGPTTTVEQVLALCAALDPERSPGRLSLVARFGASRIHGLAPLVRAVRRAGHPVLWLCDPMHGNGERTGHGLKTRRLTAVMTEISRFVNIVSAEGGRSTGLHLEASPDDIVECSGAGFTPAPGPAYRTLCDPRLNLVQAVAATACWRLPAALGAAA
ncbi:3-deoxy-7-phosphoheptulonate synthase [Streptomyces sp. NPDC101213]|uniref:3-deoxy-7-phosphoheptulonate synthase n=1 Tax=Streptomyces sp. NPDC101213 TaxID=3366130 RepID=UPI003829530F